MKPEDIYLDIGFKIHLRLWIPEGFQETDHPSYVLLHGLSSNARTWDQVAGRLAESGSRAAAIDQRGHGLSEKPDSGYDFETMVRDLQLVLQKLSWDKPILAGQSWGGNLLLEFAARHPGVSSGYVWVDGGYINLAERGSWEEVKSELKPPALEGTPYLQIAERIRQAHPGWSEAGIQATLGNFEILADQTVRPWLTLDRHLRILRAMYDQDPPALYPRVEEPVLICAADDGGSRIGFKRSQVQAAAASLPLAETLWFPGSAHDIHVDQPDRLAEILRAFGDRCV